VHYCTVLEGTCYATYCVAYHMFRQHQLNMA
jgi:hypothetical protein